MNLYSECIVGQIRDKVYNKLWKKVNEQIQNQVYITVSIESLDIVWDKVLARILQEIYK